MQLRRFGLLVIAVAVAATSLVMLRADSDGSASRHAATTVGSAAATALIATRPIDALPRTLSPVRRVYGRGASAVAVVRPRGVTGRLPVVLFLHGWGYQRSRDYRLWIAHLARRGNAVIVPRYQNSLPSDPGTVRVAMLRGLRTALRRVELERGAFVVAGHSAGAAMAADYAAIARAHGLPSPRAVYAVYPGRRIRGTQGIPAADPARIPASTRLVVLAGARDVVVGQGAARDLVAAATTVPSSRRRFVLVEDARVSDHLAPLRGSSIARRTFWRRLDRLIEVTRRTRAS